MSLSYLGERGFVIQGDPDPKKNDRTGYQLTGVGDLNGDGFDDVAITSLTANDRAGRVSVISGADDIATVDITGSSDRVLGRINGTKDRGVSTVAPAGDVNGDGNPDLVLGGYVAVPKGYTGTAHGMAWTVFGQKNGALGTIDLDSDFDGFAINGPARGRDRLGMSVSAAGDIDNDGKDDLLIGSDNVAQLVEGELKYSRAGGAAVVHGSDTRDTVYTDPTALDETASPVTDADADSRAAQLPAAAAPTRPRAQRTRLRRAQQRRQRRRRTHPR